MGYRGIYFQKATDGAVVKESVGDFEIWCKDVPFQLFGEAKELTSTNWKDEDGDDEYIPDVLPMKSYSMEVAFCYKGVMDSANEKILAFLEYLTGRDGTGSEFSVYDARTRIGRKCVRFEKFSPDGEIVRDEHDGDVIVFKVSFKVNDPVTNIVLSK